MIQKKKGRKLIKSRINGRRRRKRKSQVFLIGAIIATIYVITIAMTLHQLQTQPVDDTHEELWTLSHVYVNIKHELRTAMTMFLAAYTKNGADKGQLGQIFEQIALPQIERYCEQQGISAQLQPIQPLTIQNGTSRTNGLLKAYANVSTTIHMTLRTEHTRLEDERFLKIAYILVIRNAPPRFRAELWTITEQNVKNPFERATVQLINMESQERTTADTFHNGTYYAHTASRVDKIEVLFDTDVFFVIFFP